MTLASPISYPLAQGPSLCSGDAHPSQQLHQRSHRWRGGGRAGVQFISAACVLLWENERLSVELLTDNLALRMRNVQILLKQGTPSLTRKPRSRGGPAPLAQIQLLQGGPLGPAWTPSTQGTGLCSPLWVRSSTWEADGVW